MKKFAFFLPQFHEIEENNRWWGQGFTEWTNVKKAKPLFNRHKQPKQPLNDNYYNLLEKSTVLWQTDLMKKYHVDGLIYYHYYFTGKMLLEKPAENLLKWKDIDQPFFFCWANHTWNRSWKGSKEVLLKQEYGSVEDWEKHFNYLQPFFLDERYEKKDNKPIFMIFNSEFKERKSMFDYFEKRCKEIGFSGIYLVETFMGYNQWPIDFNDFINSVCSQTKKVFLREYIVSGNIFKQLYRYYPYRFYRKLKKILACLSKKGYVESYDGNIFYKIMLKKEPIDPLIVHGLFFEWDNTPRHKYNGSIVTSPSKSMFMRLMDHFKNEDYIFINAWNEWAEGMVLEPSKENGYKYLEWIQEWSEKK